MDAVDLSTGYPQPESSYALIYKPVIFQHLFFPYLLVKCSSLKDC